MSDARVRKRRAVSSRNRLVQETFLAPDPAPAAVGLVEPTAEEGAYRSELAGWPLKWRERWGRRANVFEDMGMSWRAAERKAFLEVGEERRAKDEERRKLSSALAGRN